MSMKKVLLLFVLPVLTLMTCCVVAMQPAGAASAWQTAYWKGVCSQGHFNTGCHGYFSGVVPSCMTSASGLCDTGRVLTGGINVNSGSAFVSTVTNALNGANTENKCGAAFIIDVMLGHGPFGSNCTAGINYAKSKLSGWETLVLSYANSTNPNYGIRWNVNANPSVNSSWWSSINDDVFHENVYHCTRTSGCPGTFNSYGTECANALADAAHGCGGKYRDDGTTGWVWKTVNVSIPIIEFYFPGGTFSLERGCANLVGNFLPPPAVGTPPTGTISVACDAAAQQTATVAFTDADGPTTGYITTGGWTSGSVSSPGPHAIPIPQSAADPYTQQQVVLHVVDVGTGAVVQVATAGTDVPCAGLACGNLDVTPTRLDPYMHFSVTVAVTNTVSQPPSPATMDLAITPPAGASYAYSGSKAAGGSGMVSTATFDNLGPTNNAGVFAVRWTLHPPSGANTVCNGTFTVTYLPYLQVYGGDVMAGSSPTAAGGAGTCATNPNAGIFSWNNHTTDFSGGGAQYAVQALAAIEDFAGAQGSDAAPPTDLSFANTYTPADAGKLNAGQGLFGGYYGGTGSDCDFTSDITGAPTTTDMTISATTIAAGAQTVRYITGADVYISGNIVYASTGGWTNVADIPYFKLVVVGGNIYINNDVTQLDGLYVAEPDGAGGGNIYTCASALGTPVAPATAGYFNTCKHQLVVNGAFVAKQVQFLRTTGSLGQAKAGDTVASNHGAEVFNYTPELWLPRGAASNDSGYAAITALPPVL